MSPSASRLLTILLLFRLCIPAAFSQVTASESSVTDTRIILEARLNDKPARLLFDTGASFSALFAGPAASFGLRSETNRVVKIAGHDVSLGLTPPLDLLLLGRRAQTKLPILPFPAPGQVDGVFSWRNLDDSPLLIDAAASRLQSLGLLPSHGWQRWPLDTNSSQLFFILSQDGKPLGRVFVDTGSTLGLRISPALWKKWREENPDAGVTLTTYRYAVGAPMVHELSWTAEYRLGDLLLRDVDIGPIPEARDGQARDIDGKDFIATIGMRGLKHLQFIVNRATGEVLTRSISPVPRHNRLGAVFVSDPKAARTSGYMAHVLPGSPAHKAGLRTGDILISLNGVEFTGKSTAGTADLEAILSRPAGTSLDLKAARAGSIHEYKVLLEDLLP